MYAALDESRRAAKKLVASVYEKDEPGGELDEKRRIPETLSAPPPKDRVTPTDLARVDGLVRRVRVTVDEIGPCIAHFYVALTIRDEEARLSEAATHAASLVEHLDDAISEIKRIENIISAG